MPRTEPRRRASSFACSALFVVALVGACGGDPATAPACPNDLPASCPAPAPAFAADVDPIFSLRCRPCHVSGGQAQSRRFDDYAAIYASRSAILNQVYACRMPPEGAAPLTSAERRTLLAWLVCGAPP